VPYSNPFYTEPIVIDGGAPLDYSQPVQVVQYVDAGAAAPATGEAVAPAVSDDAINNFEAARVAFFNGEYPQALTLVDKSLGKMPNDPALHEFRALVLFAQKQFKQSAGTIYAVLAVGPGWDWTTLVGLYPNVSIYTEQLRVLEAFSKANPGSADGRFLLAYHYMTMGHNDAARKQFEEMLKILPGDSVATQLVQTLSPKDATQVAAAPPEAPKTTPEVTAKLPELAGSWRATRPDGSTFTLTFGADSKFGWNYAKKDGSPKKFDGKYTLGGSTLVLEASNGNPLIGRITPEKTGFRLMLMGGPPNDPGLVFEKSTAG
jgi:tetratricopeptide (TPR) repeat protein